MVFCATAQIVVASAVGLALLQCQTNNLSHIYHKIENGLWPEQLEIAYPNAL